jgi:NADH-quinone oxidoreductase subunit J
MQVVEGDLVAFSITAAITLAFALGVVLTKRMFYSALMLAGTLIGVAVTFLLLNAEFLFVVQILVYVGAITTLLLFAVMFTEGGSTKEGES